MHSKDMKRVSFFLAAAAMSGTCTFAHAQFDFNRRITPPGVLEGGRAGVVMLVGREYQGSDESRVRVLPSLEYQWRNGFFAGVVSGVGYNASSRPDLSYGVRVTPEFGRQERRSEALRGLGDIDPQFDFGAFFNFSPARDVTLSSSLRFGSGNGRDGLVLDLGAGWSTSLSPSLLLGLGASASWANAAYLQEFFGIDANQAVRSGYAPYAPKSGIRDARVSASLVYRIDATWSLTGSVTYTELQGDARSSPIVRDTGTTSALVALSYSF